MEAVLENKRDRFIARKVSIVCSVALISSKISSKEEILRIRLFNIWNQKADLCNDVSFFWTEGPFQGQQLKEELTSPSSYGTIICMGMA